MTRKDWFWIFIVALVVVAATHFYDQQGANSAAKASATVVYEAALLNCQGSNPTRKAQHEYFVSIALGRSKEARADTRPKSKAVDQGIARVAYHTAKTYTNRFGARPDGTLICNKTVKRP